MLKIIFLVVFVIGGGIMRLNRRRGNSVAKSCSKKLADLANKGPIDFDRLYNTFDILIRKKTFEAGLNTQDFYTKISEINKSKNFSDKYILKSVARSLNNEYLIIADGKSNDLIPTRGGNKMVERFYAASLLIKVKETENEIEFYSTFPEDKEHEYILKNLSDTIFSLLISETYKTKGTI